MEGSAFNEWTTAFGSSQWNACWTRLLPSARAVPDRRRCRRDAAKREQPRIDLNSISHDLALSLGFPGGIDRRPAEPAHTLAPRRNPWDIPSHAPFDTAQVGLHRDAWKTALPARPMCSRPWSRRGTSLHGTSEKPTRRVRRGLERRRWSAGGGRNRTGSRRPGSRRMRRLPTRLLACLWLTGTITASARAPSW